MEAFGRDQGGIQEYCSPGEGFRGIVHRGRHSGCSVYKRHLGGSVKEASSAGDNQEANRRHAGLIKTAKCICWTNQGGIQTV